MIEHRSHKCSWKMRFEICCLEGNISITSRMRFIESIRCKSFPVCPYFFNDFFRVPIYLTSIYKFGKHFVQYSLLFFTHSFTQHIGISFAKSSQFLRKQHDLFLVHGDTIGFGQIFFHISQVKFDLLFTIFSGYEIRNVL